MYIDATGRLPSAEAVRRFLADTDPQKRDKLIDSLIGTEAFADQWAYHFGELFRTDDSRYHLWTKEWIKVDRPYNDVFYDLVTPVTKYLGGMPSVSPKPVKTSEKAEKMLRFDLDNETETIRHYRRRVRQADSLNEYAIADKTHEINRRAAEIAKEVASGWTADGRPRFVIGSIGPGTRLPSLGQIRYVDLRDGDSGRVSEMHS